MIDPTDLPAPAGFGFPFTDYPGNTAAITVGIAGQARYRRCIEGGTISKVGFHVAVTSGFVSVAVFRNTGAGRAGKPGALLAASAAVACPGVGYGEVALGATVTVKAGDWLAISVDNTTATFTGITGATASALFNGMAYSKVTEHPIVTDTPAVVTEANRLINLIGIA